MIELPKFYGLEKKRSDAERETFVRAIAGAGYDPVGVAAVIEFESAGTWDPSIRGPSGAFSTPPGYPVGLIQFSPDTAQKLGTSTYALESMSFEQQLPFVAAYYSRFFGGPQNFKDPGDYYLAGWGTSPRSDNDKVLAVQGSNAYDKNYGLDRNKDGKITAGDLRGLIDGKISAARARGFWLYDVDSRPSVVVSVVDPNGKPLGIATISEVDAPGLLTLSGLYGSPTMTAYPNGIRILNFAPGVAINARSNIPYTSTQPAKAPAFGWESAGVVLGIAGLAATIFYGARSHRRRHGRA